MPRHARPDTSPATQIDPDPYLHTIDRLEPNLAAIDPGTFYASAAISLKRIAFLLEQIHLELVAKREGPLT